MYISNEELEKIKEYVDNLYWDRDRMSRDGRYFLNKLDNYIKKLETEKEKNIYVITNNAVVDDEIDYSIYGVATDINEAKKIFNQAVKDAKTYSDFDNLDAIEENSPDFKNNDSEWIYSESDDSFELWCNGEYNSNNYSIQIKKYELDKEKELSDEYEL